MKTKSADGGSLRFLFLCTSFGAGEDDKNSCQTHLLLPAYLNSLTQSPKTQPQFSLKNIHIKTFLFVCFQNVLISVS
jgi:hypothetical protein